MCGIAGFTGLSGTADDAAAVLAGMLHRLSHRGPEGAGRLVRGGTALGQTMLGFVYVGNNPQPLVSASGRYALVFNGEIYNRAELVRELATQVQLRSESDTEVVMQLWERDGLGFAGKLRGMFAIAVHDFETGATYLARDAFGKKPLYYFVGRRGVAWASELPALLAHPDCPCDLDGSGIARYFLVNAVTSPGTLLRGVLQVPAGTIVDLLGGAITETRFWTMPSPNEAGARDESEYESRLEAALVDAVRRRVESSEVPLGTFLSGGLDSSLVTAIAQRIAGDPLPVFSAGFEDESYDETVHAATVARHLGCRHLPVRLSRRDLADVVIREYSVLDAPLADPSLAPSLLLARHASSFVKGVLSGDGADEIYLGYRFFQAVKLLTAAEHIAPSRLLGYVRDVLDKAPVSHTNMSGGFLGRLLARGFGTAPERRWYESTAAFSSAELPSIFSGGRSPAGGEPLYAELERFLGTGAARPKSAIARAQFGMICHYLRDVILSKVDRASMRNGLEVRSPFLDTELVALAMTIPQAARMRGYQTKSILKRVALRYLPRDIVYRKKQGFRAPVAALLCGELREFADDLFAPESLAHHGLFRADTVRRLWDEHQALRRDHSKPLWSLMCFQAWYHGTYRSRFRTVAIPETREAMAT